MGKQLHLFARVTGTGLGRGHQWSNKTAAVSAWQDEPPSPASAVKQGAEPVEQILSVVTTVNGGGVGGCQEGLGFERVNAVTIANTCTDFANPRVENVYRAKSLLWLTLLTFAAWDTSSRCINHVSCRRRFALGCALWCRSVRVWEHATV